MVVEKSVSNSYSSIHNFTNENSDFDASITGGGAGTQLEGFEDRQFSSISALAGLTSGIGSSGSRMRENLQMINRLSTPVSDTTGLHIGLPEISFCGSEYGMGGVLENRTPVKSTRRMEPSGDHTITHTEGDKKVEEWTIKYMDGKVIAVQPQIGRDSFDDKQNLHNTRKSLVAQVESSNFDANQKLEVFRTMQQLEQLARAGKLGHEVDFVRTDLAANYLHADRLMASQAPFEDIIKSLIRPSSTLHHLSDDSGNFDSAGKRNKEQKDQRENEFWSASSTSLKDRSIVTFGLNGREVDAWEIRFNGDKVDRVESLLHPDPVLGDARRSLVDAVQKSEMSSTEKLEFLKNLAQLEDRARRGDMGANRDATNFEIKGAYKHLGKLLDSSINGKVSVKDRVTLARQLAYQFANTKDIDQGMASDGCRMSVVECRLAVTRPSVVAKLVSDVAFDGQVTIGHQKVSLDADSLKPSSELATRFPHTQDERSFASQLFQLTCMNLLGSDPEVVREHVHFANLIKGEVPIKNFQKLVFQQKPEVNGDRDEKGKLHKKNNGLRVFGDNGNGLEELTVKGKLREGTNQILLQAHMTQRLIDRLDPGRHGGTVWAHEDALYYTRDNLNGSPRTDTGMTMFNSPEDLARKLEAAQTAGRFPIILVTRDKEPDPGDEKGPDDEDMEWNETNHVVTIRKFIPAKIGAGGVMQPARIETDDQFGRDYDKRNLSVEAVYKMTIGKRP